MKVSVNVVVHIDPEAWTANYGTSGAAAIRDDVKSYVQNGAVEQLREVGVLIPDAQVLGLTTA